MLEQEQKRLTDRAEKEQRDEIERQRVEDEIAGKFLADSVVPDNASNDADAWAGTVFGDSATQQGSSSSSTTTTTTATTKQVRES